MRCKHWIGIGASIILGLIFIVAGLGKLLDQAPVFKWFFASFLSLLTPVLAKIIFTWLPCIELAAGLLLVIGVATKFVTTFTLLLIIGFLVNNSWLLIQGLGDKPCDCFGVVERISEARLSIIGSLYIDIGMLALVLITLFCYQGGFFNIYHRFLTEKKKKLNNE